MAKETFYTAIDLGSTKVCTLVSRVGQEGELKIVGMGVAQSQGVHKGQVQNILEATEAVRASLEEGKRYVGKGVSWAYVGVAGTHISCLNTNGQDQPNGEQQARTTKNVRDLIHRSFPEIHKGQEVLHVIPRTYTNEGLKVVRSPEGLHANNTDLEHRVVVGNAPALKKVKKAVRGSGISVNSLVLGPLAAGEACLTEDQREMGVVLVDIGGGTTDIAVFREGSLWYTAVIPVGGNQVTRDLSVSLGVPYYFAEDAKIRWGHALPEEVGDEEVLIPTFQGRHPRAVSRHSLSIPLYERLSETVKLIMLKLQEAGVMRVLPPGGIVFTGGTASIPGLAELGKKLTGGPSRIGYPRHIPGLPTELEDPAYSSSIGILLWGIKHHGEKQTYKNGKRTFLGYKTLVRKVKNAVLARTASGISGI